MVSAQNFILNETDEKIKINSYFRFYRISCLSRQFLVLNHPFSDPAVESLTPLISLTISIFPFASNKCMSIKSPLTLSVFLYTEWWSGRISLSPN